MNKDLTVINLNIIKDLQIVKMALHPMAIIKDQVVDQTIVVVEALVHNLKKVKVEVKVQIKINKKALITITIIVDLQVMEAVVQALVEVVTIITLLL